AGCWRGAGVAARLRVAVGKLVSGRRTALLLLSGCRWDTRGVACLRAASEKYTSSELPAIGCRGAGVAARLRVAAGKLVSGRRTALLLLSGCRRDTRVVARLRTAPGKFSSIELTAVGCRGAGVAARLRVAVGKPSSGR